MTELLQAIIRQFNNVLYYDSRYFRVLVLDPLLMNDHSFLAFYKETIGLYSDENEIAEFKKQTVMQKNAIVFKLITFAARRKYIADGKTQLEFFKDIFHEGMVQVKKIFNELVIPWLEDFKVISQDKKYSVLLDYYTYQTKISDVPLYGEFAIAIHDKIYTLEDDERKKNSWRVLGWCAII